MQLITFCIAVVTLDSMERRRPGLPVVRERDLKLNLLALFVVITAGESARVLSFAVLHAVVPAFFLTWDIFSGLPSFFKVLTAVILTDLSLYWVHRAMHKKLLWKTHAFHHSIGQIWWLSGSRTSLTHLFLFSLPQIFIGYFLLKLTPLETGAAFSFGVVINLWIHTNIHVSLGPVEKFFITPDYHRIHHGARGMAGRNLGFVFTIWDKWFGTYTAPQAGNGVPVLAVPLKGRLLKMLIGI
jgi:sterol desaturase/sphingolipid hydroxylase (fatty acid hydroxylase superfamily)